MRKNFFSLSFLQRKQQTISLSALTIFLEQFLLMLNAGIAITRIFEIQKNLQSTYAMQYFLNSCHQIILSGGTLAQAFQFNIKVIDPLIYQLIKIGEAVGNLPQMLSIGKVLLENKMTARRQLKQLMAYPIFLLIVSLITMSIMFFYVIPQFENMFANSRSNLPALTALLFNISDFLLAFYSYLIFIFLIFVCAIFYHQQFILKIAQHFFWQLPILRQLHQQITIHRFVQQLAISLAAGITLFECLKILDDESSPKINAVIKTLRQTMMTGHSLATAMLETDFFPMYVIDIVSVGEESGKLIEVLQQITQYLEKENQHAFKQLQQLLEPLILLLLGVLIGVIVIGMYLPIFNIGSLLSP